MKNKKMSKKKKNQGKKVVLILRETPEPLKKRRFKDVLFFASLVMFFLITWAILYQYTDVFEYWERVFFGDPTTKYIEMEVKKTFALKQQYMSNKDELSREVRLDLLIATKRFNKILKKYLSPRQYNIFLMLDYIGQYRMYTKNEGLYLWYLYEIALNQVTSDEKELIEEDREVINRMKAEFKKIQPQKPGK